MNNNEIMLLNRFGLVTNKGYQYSEIANIFYSSGYTSMAGNTYYNALRLCEGIVIKEDVGQGYIHTFLNGIRIFDISSKNILCEKSYHCQYYDKFFIKNEVVEMLKELLFDASKKCGLTLDKFEIARQIELVVRKAFNEDQRILLQTQSQKYLL